MCKHLHICKKPGCRLQLSPEEVSEIRGLVKKVMVRNDKAPLTVTCCESRGLVCANICIFVRSQRVACSCLQKKCRKLEGWLKVMVRNDKARLTATCCEARG
ncbi:hypothetical protein CEXT_711141 [Caerostris extrusa]|uniref:Uncharacterized protein n=1 Tax=Caerostris extrusa TaxID=172846 RepID=A0AAV4Y359_CAEEX|nr:hypothetical protein CEXT_711141 [Caerostris extrusa]